MKSFVFFILFALGFHLPSKASLVVDLSAHMIAITSGFKGADVILFGTKGEEEGNLVVVVRGPMRDFLVQKKEKLLGIWVNKKRVEFQQTPSFYGIYSDLPIDHITAPSVIQRFQFSLQNLDFNFSRKWATEKRDLFKQAFIEDKQKNKLYHQEEGSVHFIASNLFRLKLNFPSNVPTGVYAIDTYLIRDSKVVSAQSIPLFITKIGLSAEISVFSKDHPIFYGLLAVLFALTLGWLGGILLRRG
jgi:uncharacterized protein (TIGR02186 family)